MGLGQHGRSLAGVIAGGLLAAVALAGPAHATTKVDVEWTATGTYKLDAVDDKGGNCRSEFHFTANIDSTFVASFEIPDNSRTTTVVDGGIANPFATTKFDGEDVIPNDDGTTCSGPYPFHCPEAPWTATGPSMLVGAGAGDPIRLGIQPATHVGAGMNPCSKDPSTQSAYDEITAGALNDSLPEGFETNVVIDEQQLRSAGELTTSQTIGNADTGLPPDCSDALGYRLGSDKTVCNQNLSLSVTVTAKLADGCPAGYKRSGERCLTAKEKEEMGTGAEIAKARAGARRCTKAQRKPSRIGPEGCNAIDQSVNEALKEANAYSKLAADPPDPNFDGAVHLHVPAVHELGGDASAFDDFRQADARFEALLEALLHSLEKGAGAAEAGDTVWVDKHNAETQRFALQALDALNDRAKAAKGAMREFKDGLGPKRTANTLFGDDLGDETDAAVAAFTLTASFSG